MKDYPSGIIVPEEFMWNSLYDTLKGGIKKDPHIGDNVDILIQTSRPFTGKGWGENIDIPYPDDMGFIKTQVPLYQVIANAGVTKQSLDRATGGDASWGRVVDRVLADQRTDFLWTMELSAAGAGTGALARVVSYTWDGGTTTMTVTCDNTYTDFGWENVALLKKGMWVEIYDSTFATQRVDANSNGTWQVASVTFGSRNNGAATTGTFTFVAADEIAEVVDNDVVFLAGAKSDGLGSSKYSPTGALPMGLLGLVQGSGDGYGGAADITTFQGLTRSSYPTLLSTVYQASDFVSGASDGTPNDWDLSVVSDAISQVETSTGRKTTHLLCSSQLAMAIMRLNRSESSITVNVASTGAQNQSAVGSQYARQFLCPDGRLIPIVVSKTIPRNVLYGIDADAFRIYTKGDFDFLRLNGDIWDKSYNDRKANFEAPYGGYWQIGAERCDSSFCIQDMKDNL